MAIPPITAQLRATVKRYNKYSSMTMPCESQTYVKCDADTFDRMCDAIDAIHSALEAENEYLRERADKYELGNKVIVNVKMRIDWESMAEEFERAADTVRTLEEKGGK